MPDIFLRVKVDQDTGRFLEMWKLPNGNNIPGETQVVPRDGGKRSGEALHGRPLPLVAEIQITKSNPHICYCSGGQLFCPPHS